MLMSFLSAIEAWISDHANLVTVIGIPFLTYLVTLGLNRSAERRAFADRKTERRLATELKLVEFRQDWINRLRTELVGYTAMVATAGAAGKDFDRWEELAERIATIELLMNPGDERYEDLKKRMTNLAKDAFVDGQSVTETVENLTALSQSILKQEWERLKSDLKNVELEAT